MSKLTHLPLFLLILAAGPAAAAEDDLLAPAAAPVVPAGSGGGESAFALPVQADESVYVVQRRAYSKSGKLELTPLFFTSLNNKFVGHFGPAVAAAFHIRENFAIELMTAVPYVMQSFYSALVYEVYHYERLTPEVVDLKKMTYFGSLGAQFSALYGKMELYGWLIDYDFYATAGFGPVTTLETCVPNQDDCSDDDDDIGRGTHPPADTQDRLKIAGSLGGGVRFFFADWLGLRLELRDIVYADRAADSGRITTDIRSNVLFFAGLSFLL